MQFTSTGEVGGGWERVSLIIPGFRYIGARSTVLR